MSPHVFQCQVLQKDVLRDNTLDCKDCSYIWSTCDISDIKLLQKGHGELGGSMGKGMGTPLHSTGFLPYSGSLSGIPKHHGRDGEHKAGLPKCMQLPTT